MAFFLRPTSNDWDLEAIIRGHGGGEDSSRYLLPPPPPSLGIDGLEFETEAERGEFNELEELYKPFVAQVEQIKHQEYSPMSSGADTASPCSSSFVVFDHDEDVEKPKEEEMKEVVRLETQPKSSSKRRKSKQKIVRVVHRGVVEDGVLMDKWNWRKYGQKAIKGSPHPRSYYRCSSPGGCQARKHVEQSKEESEKCIVTYIGEHTHSPPTRRHAQAGRKITKFSSSPTKVVRKNIAPTTSLTVAASTNADQWMVNDGVLVGEEEWCSGSSSVINDFFATPNHDSFGVWDHFDPFFTPFVN